MAIKQNRKRQERKYPTAGIRTNPRIPMRRRRLSSNDGKVPLFTDEPQSDSADFQAPGHLFRTLRWTCRIAGFLVWTVMLAVPPDSGLVLSRMLVSENSSGSGNGTEVASGAGVSVGILQSCSGETCDGILGASGSNSTTSNASGASANAVTLLQTSFAQWVLGVWAILAWSCMPRLVGWSFGLLAYHLQKVFGRGKAGSQDLKTNDEKREDKIAKKKRRDAWNELMKRIGMSGVWVGLILIGCLLIVLGTIIWQARETYSVGVGIASPVITFFLLVQATAKPIRPSKAKPILRFMNTFATFPIRTVYTVLRTPKQVGSKVKRFIREDIFCRPPKGTKARSNGNVV